MGRHPAAVLLTLVCWLAPRAGWATSPQTAGPQCRATVVTAVGDINLGTAYPLEDYLPPDGGNNLLPPVKGFLSGDVVFGNLEGPLADEGQTDKCGSSTRCFAFRTPTSYVKHLMDAGFTVLSVANNHALDFGEPGREATLRTLDRAGIAHSGPVGDLAEIEVNGKKIALVAFTTADHSHNLIEVGKASELVARLDETHDLVLVSFHGGAEGLEAMHTPDQVEYLGTEPRGHLILFARTMVDAGADLLLGHGPHVLRGMEVYRRRLIAYSLGNFCTYGRFNLTGPRGRAAVLSVDLDPETGEFLGGWLRATFQEKPGGPKPDPDAEGITLIERMSLEDFRFTSPTFQENGRLLPPPGDGAGLFSLKRPEDRRRLRLLLDEFADSGMDEMKLRRTFGDKRAELLPEVLKRFSRPAEKLPYPRYRNIFINPETIQAGKKFLVEKEKLLQAVEKKFQVDRQLLTGLIAAETRFGVHRGDYLTFNALATLVFQDPRRQRWAKKQLRALLSVFLDDPLAVTGSYAGAVGLVQFMPVSIQDYGVDWDGDGRVNLDDWGDALASAANYLMKSGWKQGHPITRGTANYRALFRYNPAHNYARVVAELSRAFGYRLAEAEKKKKMVQDQRKKPRSNIDAKTKKVPASPAGDSQPVGAP